MSKKTEKSIQEKIDAYGSRRMNRFDREEMYRAMVGRLIKPLRDKFAVKAREFLDAVLQASMTEVQYHHFCLLPPEFFPSTMQVYILRPGATHCSYETRIEVVFEHPWNHPQNFDHYHVKPPECLQDELKVLNTAYNSIQAASTELDQTVKPIVFAKVSTFKGLFTLFPELLEYSTPASPADNRDCMALVPIQQARSFLTSLERRVARVTAPQT